MDFPAEGRGSTTRGSLQRTGEKGTHLKGVHPHPSTPPPPPLSPRGHVPVPASGKPEQLTSLQPHHFLTTITQAHMWRMDLVVTL